MSGSETIEDLPPCLISIDKEGNWSHKGVEMIHRDFIRLFYRNMELDTSGRYLINWNGEKCYVDVEDTAFVVRKAARGTGRPAGEERFVLYLSDDSCEDLVPETLFVGKGHVLYCRVKDQRFPARFNRPAYYQIAQAIIEDNGAFYLLLGGRKYPVSTIKDQQAG